LKDVDVQRVAISYDIACKWSINHLKRFAENHPDLNVEGFEFSYYIPKFHLPGHGASCQTSYSFNYARGVGRTHGETVEQEWAHINPAAVATREMGPGARHLTLDDNWSGWNWKKILGMGERLLEGCVSINDEPRVLGDLLHRSLLKALVMKDKHTAANNRLNEGFTEKLRNGWIKMIRDWEKDKSKPNPFTHTEKG
jgi:Kyakuja-Dileera-Zisupton transposase